MTAPSGVSTENPWAGQGSVLLDIGGDVGALVVEMPAAMEGVEVEARRTAETTVGHVHHPHVAVVNRPVEGGVQPSLVFPELVEGGYGLGLKGAAEVHLVAVVRGGEVTTVTWPQ
jgi:hypothetical protein